jgi:hypothetical protein
MDKFVADNANETIIEKNKKVIHNKGTGAGGAATNLSGKDFERCSFISDVNSVKEKIGQKFFINENEVVRYATQHKIVKMLKHYYEIEAVKIDGYRPVPDEAMYVEKQKTLYVLEYKTQNRSGSVDEKLNGGVAKLRQLNKMFDNKVVVKFGFVLSNFFDVPKKYPAWIEDIKQLDKIPVFWNDQKGIKNHICRWLDGYDCINYDIEMIRENIKLNPNDIIGRIEQQFNLSIREREAVRVQLCTRPSNKLDQ